MCERSISLFFITTSRISLETCKVSLKIYSNCQEKTCSNQSLWSIWLPTDQIGYLQVKILTIFEKISSNLNLHRKSAYVSRVSLAMHEVPCFSKVQATKTWRRIISEKFQLPLASSTPQKTTTKQPSLLCTPKAEWIEKTSNKPSVSIWSSVGSFPDTPEVCRYRTRRGFHV